MSWISRSLRSRRALASLAALALLAAACGGSDEEGLQEITFMAGFRAQANLPFVAVYVADANGYFEEEGLAVTIRHSSGADEHLKLLLEQDVEFITGTGAQALRRYADGLPLRAVALFGQRGDQGFVARADSGIAAPADFRGRSVGFKAGVVPAELHALLATAGLTIDDVRLQAVGFDPRVFIEGQVEVYPVFLDNEPDTIRRAGVEIVVIDPHEHGVPTLGLTYLAHEATLAEDPQLVERFLRATLRGALWARDNVEEAVEITVRFAEGADPAHQRFLLETDLANAERADGIGRSTPDQWQALAEVLLRHGVLDEPVDATAVFDATAIERIYANGPLD
ncbi:MAG: ABC transporter substrate-binding protein [Chloroflexi bacterium]|nr:ABC transporter substrate-binding protein [Chloroflexota bacterium]